MHIYLIFLKRIVRLRPNGASPQQSSRRLGVRTPESERTM
jgi:hypothetical protein